MMYLDTILLLKRCEQYELATEILNDILLNGNKLRLHSNESSLNVENTLAFLKKEIKSLIDSFVFSKIYEFDYWLLELFNNEDLILAINFEDETIEISEKYFDFAYEVIKNHFKNDSLYKNIDSIKVEKDPKLLNALNNFEYLRALTENQIVKIDDDTLFSYDTYQSIIGNLYPLEVQDCFEKLKKGNWSKENYNKVLYCNCLIYFSLGVI